ncbi:MAG: N-acetylmuramoyl-L-alanine amidase [Oscillospiraceae bacterium]|nr:N-acetylmuramoyl-L-alanine amidase [Oscillospiraceae bacterium]MBQ6243188.1 N-acetylmuramoyl-L-alanine amidase [Bacteroidales bacterium]
MKKDNIDAIVIHCSATPEGKDVRAADIDKIHRARGFKMIGYHYVIDLDGNIEQGRPLTMNGAHCEKPGFSGRPYNSHSIGICYIGGVAKDGKTPKDTRTDAQKLALQALVANLTMQYPIREIIGHRDASPDLNGDGKISKWEWMKACPSFEVKAEFPLAICESKSSEK